MKLIFKFIACGLIFSCCTVSTFAFVVSAPMVESQLAIMEGNNNSRQISQIAKWTQSIQQAVKIYQTGVKQVQEIQKQIEQGKQEFDFWKKHAGDWQAIAARIRTGASSTALEQGTFCGTPNMGAGDLFPADSSVQGLANAVEEAKKLMAGRQSQLTPTGLRDLITRIVGKIPETENAGVATFAQTSIEDDIAFMGKANKAIVELQAEKQRIREEREAKVRTGTFTDADKVQYDMADNDIQGQVQTLQLQSLIRVNQQLVVSNSFRVKAQNDSERRKIAEGNLRRAGTAFFGNN